jgi:hypothetical protein
MDVWLPNGGRKGAPGDTGRRIPPICRDPRIRVKESVEEL